MNYKLYVPDTEKWTRYYQLQAQGKCLISPRTGERMDVDSFLELYGKDYKNEPKKTKPKESPHPPVIMTSPTQQVVEQAKAELKRRRKSIKEKDSPRTVTPKKKSKRSTSSQTAVYKLDRYHRNK